MDEAQHAEYVEEIADLRARLVKLEQDKADATLIAEYAAEVRILEALLLAAIDLRDQIRERPELAELLGARSFSAASFKDIYAFVYDCAIELELGNRDLAQAIEQTDFATLLG
jgi:hypothetical protein